MSEAEVEGSSAVRSRVVGVERVAVSEIVPSRWGNPRAMGERDAAALSRGMEEVGFVEAVIGWRNESGALELINGHHRLGEVQAQGGRKIDAVVVDVSAEEARVLGLSLNSIAAGWNLRDLDKYARQLVAEVDAVDLSTFGDMTAFTGTEVRALAEQGTGFLNDALGDGKIPTWASSEEVAPPTDEVQAPDRPLNEPTRASAAQDAIHGSSVDWAKPAAGAPRTPDAEPTVVDGVEVSLQAAGGSTGGNHSIEETGLVERTSMTLMMTAEERSWLIAAVNHAKGEGSANGAEALTDICREYLEGSE